MPNQYNIAVVGCGTAGPAAALYLSKLGHQVTVFERVPDPKPVGAGILLQPTGLTALAELDVLSDILLHGAKVEHLYGATQQGRKVLDLAYRDLNKNYFGVGIHRGALLTILMSRFAAAGVKLHCGVEITHINNLANGQAQLLDSHQQEQGIYDMVVVADGARSILRGESTLVKKVRPYPWGALWAICPDPAQKYRGTLAQQYHGTSRMAGILPTGHLVGELDKPLLISLFWSIDTTKIEEWRSRGLSIWRDEAKQYWPYIAPLIDQITNIEQVTFASYSDVRMSGWHTDRLVYIGDAAHAMSPQLGQGANLSLFDAMILADCLRQAPNIAVALANYSRQRRYHIRYYQVASSYLTQFFQSNREFLAIGRDLFMGLLCRTPYIRTQMLYSLAGLKNGLFTALPQSYLKLISSPQN